MKYAEDPGRSVMLEDIIPPVQDSAKDNVNPFSSMSSCRSDATIEITHGPYPAHSVDGIDDLCNGFRHQRPPIATVGHPPSDLCTGMIPPVVQWCMTYLISRLREKTSST